MTYLTCWWDEKADLGIYLTPQREFGTYSRPYGVIMGEAPANTPAEWQEIDVCHAMNWDWANMEYDLPPSQDVIRHFPATGNYPQPIERRLPVSESEQIRGYFLSFDEMEKAKHNNG